MLFLYPKNQTNFDANGEPIQNAFDCHVVRNDSFHLNFKVHLGRHKSIKRDMIVSAWTPSGRQPFRIWDITQHADYIEVDALHVIYDLTNRVCGSVNINEQSLYAALSAYERSFKRGHAPFTFSTSIEKRRTFNTDKEKDLFNAFDVLMDGAHSIVGTWECELDVNGYDIRFVQKLGARTNALLYEHKNISQFENKESNQSLCTRIYAISKFRADGAHDDTKLEVVVDSPLINEYAVVHERVYENNNARTEEELRQWAQRKFTYDKIDLPTRSIKVSTNIIDGTEINYGDDLVLKYTSHDINEEIRCVGYDYDGINQEFYSIELGSVAKTLGDVISGKVEELSEEGLSNLALKQVEEVTRTIMAADGIHKITYGPDEPLNPREGDQWRYFTHDRPNEVTYKQFIDGQWKIIIDAYTKNRIDEKFAEVNAQLEQSTKSLEAERQRIDGALTDLGVTKDLAQVGKNIAQSALDNAGELAGKIIAEGKRITSLADKVTQGEVNTAKKFELAEILAKRATGVGVKDPSFDTGLGQLQRYNNLYNGTVSIERVEGTSDQPNGKQHRVIVRNNGGKASPERGGVMLATKGRANAEYIVSFTAKLQAGYRFHIARNAIGDGGSHQWLTDFQGTGKWQHYAYHIKCGATGNFSWFGHVYVIGGTAGEAFEWEIQDYDVIDITKSYSDTVRDIIKGVENDTQVKLDKVADNANKLIQQSQSKAQEALAKAKENATKQGELEEDLRVYKEETERKFGGYLEKSVFDERTQETETQMNEFQQSLDGFTQSLDKVKRDAEGKVSILSTEVDQTVEGINKNIAKVESRFPKKNIYPRTGEVKNNQTRFVITSVFDFLGDYVGKEATFSFEMRIESDGVERDFLFYHYQHSGIGIKIDDTNNPHKKISATKEWQTFTYSGEVIRKSVPTNYHQGAMIIYDPTGNNKFSVRNVQVLVDDMITSTEFNDVKETATAYERVLGKTSTAVTENIARMISGSPLAESVTQQQASIKQLSDSLESKVARTDFDSLNQRVTRSETSITQLDNKITTKLSRGEVERLVDGKGYATTESVNQLETKTAESLTREISKVERSLLDLTPRTEFNSVKETADIYERIIGRTEGEATTNISRMLRSSELFMSEITTGGRRNLYTGTKNFDGSDWATIAEFQKTSPWLDGGTYDGAKVLKSVHKHNGKWQNIEVKAGEKITFSVYAKADTTMSNVIMQWHWDGAPFPATKPVAQLPYTARYVTVTPEWRRYHMTVTATRDGSLQCRIEKTTSDTTNNLYIAKIQVEKGDLTDWTESPHEQVTNRIAQIGRLLELGLFGQEGILDGILIGRDIINIKSKLINLDGDVRMNNAFVTKLITQHLDTNTLRAMVANINQLNAIQVNANNITTGTMTGINLRGGVLSALNGASSFNLNTGELQFFTDSAAMRRVVSGHPNQFVQFGFDDVYSNDGSQIVRTASTAIGSNRWDNNLSVNGGFSGVRIFNRSQNPYVDRIQYISDLHEYTHTGNKNDFQNNIWIKPATSVSDWAQLYPSFSGNRGNSSLGTWTQPWGVLFVEELYIVKRNSAGVIIDRRQVY